LLGLKGGGALLSRLSGFLGLPLSYLGRLGSAEGQRLGALSLGDGRTCLIPLPGRRLSHLTVSGLSSLGFGHLPVPSGFRFLSPPLGGLSGLLRAGACGLGFGSPVLGRLLGGPGHLLVPLCGLGNSLGLLGGPAGLLAGALSGLGTVLGLLAPALGSRSGLFRGLGPLLCGLPGSTKTNACHSSILAAWHQMGRPARSHGVARSTAAWVVVACRAC
jgi:hypothetical protein